MLACDATTFIWKIENISLCSLQTGDCIESPYFVEKWKNTKWKLKLYPRGLKDNGYASCFLWTEDDAIEIGKRKFEMSILGKEHNNLQHGVKNFVPSHECGYENFILSKYLFGSDLSFLRKNALNIRCQIWKNDGMSRSNNLLLGKSFVKYEKKSFTWTINDFFHYESSSKEFTTLSFDQSGFPRFHIELSKPDIYSGNNLNSKHEKIQIAIRRNSHGNYTILKYKVSVLNDGKSVISKEGNHLFPEDPPTSEFMIPPFFSYYQLDSLLNLYLWDDVLTLRFDLTVSGNVENPEKIHSLSQINAFGTNSSLKRNLKALYLNNRFCDVTLTSKDKTFQAHRIILCARSPVFDVLLSKASEKSPCVLDISDIEPDILETLLKYMYSDSLESLEWYAAKELYVAAHKYKITSLAEECSAFLTFNAFPSALSELSELAKMYQDMDLDESVQNLTSFFEL